MRWIVAIGGISCEVMNATHDGYKDTGPHGYEIIKGVGARPNGTSIIKDIVIRYEVMDWFSCLALCWRNLVWITNPLWINDYKIWMHYVSVPS